jgi:hypothetical protein
MRVGHALWRDRLKLGDTVAEGEGINAALESVWRAKREYRIELAKSSSKKGNLTRPCCTSRGSRREPPALARGKIARPVAVPPGFYRDRT